MLDFTPAEVEALVRGPRPWEDSSERECPACGARKVRSYLQEAPGRSRPSLIGYVWCANCRRFHGATGPMPAGLSFEDPLADRRMPWGSRGDGFFRILDEAWERGLLPQRFLSLPAGSQR